MIQLDQNETEELTVEMVTEVISELSTKIRKASDEYYNQNESSVSDTEYDKWKVRLIELEKLFPALKQDNSPSDQVGAPASGRFRKVKHVKPMLSMENAFNKEDLLEFDRRTRNYLGVGTECSISYTAEPKIDGIAISLTYKKGKLVLAATRGGGEIGEDVTRNIRTIEQIPTEIEQAPDFMEIRGEIFMKHADFEALNQGLIEASEVDEAEARKKPRLYSNPRNAASGAVRQLDPEITRARNLSFIAHGWGHLSDTLAPSQMQSMKRLESFGFPINSLICESKSMDDVIAYYDKISVARSTLEFDIDGIACKINDVGLQERLGHRSAWPRWAIACKFPPDTSWTRITGIDIQVGRTGALSPVARLETVFVGGVNVTNVTLHNEDYIAGVGADSKPIRNGIDIRIGDLVEVYRSGDVIPKISGVDLTCRLESAKPFEFPNTCPICGSPALRTEGDAVRRCTGGLNCQAQIIEWLKHFVSIDAFNIEGFGEKIIEQFFEVTLANDKKLLKEPADIFRLEENISTGDHALKDWKGWGENSAQNLFNEINKKRTVSFARFLYSLGIRYVGMRSAERIADHFGNWERFYSELGNALLHPELNWDELVAIDGIGINTAKSIQDTFLDNKFRTMIEDLVSSVTIEAHSRSQIIESPIANKSIVFTGGLTSMTRAEAKARAEAQGARIYGSVSKNIDIVVAGEGSGSKEKKAQALGLEILNEEQWLNLIKASDT